MESVSMVEEFMRVCSWPSTFVHKMLTINKLKQFEYNTDAGFSIMTLSQKRQQKQRSG